jgi:excisionase family DNA binding protein
MDAKNQDQLLTAEEVAAYLQVSVQWVLQHARGERRPVLRRVKVGHFVRFRKADIMEFVAGVLKR